MLKAFSNCIDLCLNRIISLLIVISMVLVLCSCSNTENNFDGLRFERTRHITVLVDSSSKFDSSYTVDSSLTAQYIRDKVLKDCNIDELEQYLNR